MDANCRCVMGPGAGGSPQGILWMLAAEAILAICFQTADGFAKGSTILLTGCNGGVMGSHVGFVNRSEYLSLRSFPVMGSAKGSKPHPYSLIACRDKANQQAPSSSVPCMQQRKAFVQGSPLRRCNPFFIARMYGLLRCSLARMNGLLIVSFPPPSNPLCARSDGCRPEPRLALVPSQ